MLFEAVVFHQCFLMTRFRVDACILSIPCEAALSGHLNALKPSALAEDFSLLLLYFVQLRLVGCERGSTPTGQPPIPPRKPLATTRSLGPCTIVVCSA